MAISNGTNPYIAQAKADTGIDPNKNFADLSWDEKMRYQQRLSQLTAAHASEFPADTVAAAQQILAQGVDPEPVPYSTIDAIESFSGEFENQALRLGDSVASVGNGVMNTLKLGSWLIPVGVVILAAIWIFGFYKKQVP